MPFLIRRGSIFPWFFLLRVRDTIVGFGIIIFNYKTTAKFFVIVYDWWSHANIQITDKLTDQLYWFHQNSYLAMVKARKPFDPRSIESGLFVSFFPHDTIILHHLGWMSLFWGFFPTFSRIMALFWTASKKCFLHLLFPVKPIKSVSA